jgi:hypothetical protein
MADGDGDERDGKARGVDVNEEKGLVVGPIREDILSTGYRRPMSAYPKPPRSKKTIQRALTLARKLDSVHKNTTISNKTIPRVLRATPPKPSFSRRFWLLPRPDDAAPDILESEVKVRESEGSGSGEAASMAVAVRECDLRLEAEVPTEEVTEGCVYPD